MSAAEVGPVLPTEDPDEVEQRVIDAAEVGPGDGREPCPYPCSICVRKGRQ